MVVWDDHDAARAARRDEAMVECERPDPKINGEGNKHNDSVGEGRW